MTHKLYAEGEEIYEGSLENILKQLKEIEDDHVRDELQNQEKWPQDYYLGYDFHEAAREYIHDVYEVSQILDMETLKW